MINNKGVNYPPATRELHHEVELVVALSGGGLRIPEQSAMSCVYGYAVGIDLTCRDLQQSAKKLEGLGILRRVLTSRPQFRR